MSRLIKKTSQKAGLPPGTLVHIGERKIGKARITIIDYDESNLEEIEARTVEECLPYKDKPTTTWINIDGIHETEVIERIGQQFTLHPLLLEDIVNTGQRPKMEDFGDCLFLVLKMLSYADEDHKIEAEQVSLILGPNFVISFQEREGDIFDTIRERIRKGKGRIRKAGADYLAYMLIDAIVDNYFIVLETLGEEIEDIEAELASNPTTKMLHKIRTLKNEMLFLRKSLWPLREVVSGLQRGESILIQQSTQVYLRDVYDHTIQIIDTVETLRDMLSGMLDIYLSSVSNKMNEVMKVLTIFASIFIPLTFVVGIYGMNFEFMPELKWHWGYPVVLIVMAAIATALAFYFKRKKWL
ncbi:MAG: magnesium/cobalt transporter CorA [Dehalococcoidales bacterium]|nr:magnesium/cobalt transporter CorA [Dehalococcoidales bacterium]